jgi:hypothetical protein
LCHPGNGGCCDKFTAQRTGDQTEAQIQLWQKSNNIVRPRDGSPVIRKVKPIKGRPRCKNTSRCCVSISLVLEIYGLDRTVERQARGVSFEC